MKKLQFMRELQLVFYVFHGYILYFLGNLFLLNLNFCIEEIVKLHWVE